jgi:hypothetical protein
MEQDTPTGLVSKGVRFLGTARPSGALRVIFLGTLPFENTSFEQRFFFNNALTTGIPPLLKTHAWSYLKRQTGNCRVEYEV